MNLHEARAAIEAILAAIDDDAIPPFDKVEHDDRTNGPLVWWGGHGYAIASGRDGKGNPTITDYRARGSWQAVEYEMVDRASKRHYAEHPIEVTT